MNTPAEDATHQLGSLQFQKHSMTWPKILRRRKFIVLVCPLESAFCGNGPTSTRAASEKIIFCTRHVNSMHATRQAAPWRAVLRDELKEMAMPI